MLHAECIKINEVYCFLTDKCRGSYYGGCPITRMCNSLSDGVTCGECFPGYVTNPNSPTGDCLRKSSNLHTHEHKHSLSHTCSHSTHTHTYTHTVCDMILIVSLSPAVITISFEQESYTALEGSSQQLEVCAHTTDRIKNEQRLILNAGITMAVGATQGIPCVHTYS